MTARRTGAQVATREDGSASAPADDRAHVADEAIEMIKKEEMPLTEYTWTHGDARLSMDHRVALTGYFSGLAGGGGSPHED